MGRRRQSAVSSELWLPRLPDQLLAPTLISSVLEMVTSLRPVPAALFTITHLLTWNIGLLCTTLSKAFLKSEEITARLLLLTLGAVSLKNSIRLTKHGFTMVPLLDTCN